MQSESTQPLHPRALELITRFELAENAGGYFKEQFKATTDVQPADDRDTRKSLSHIYYLLKKGQNMIWHKDRSSEIWNFYEGSPVELIWYQDGKKHTKILGPVSENSEPYVAIPGESWQMAIPLGDYTFGSATLGPAWEVADFSFLPEGVTDPSELK